AAYDPVNDTWRRIADHPDPAREPRAMGTGAGRVVGRPDEALWRYDAGTDTWERLGRTRYGLDLLAVTGDRMVAYASTHEVLGPPDHIHDPSTERWRALPPDPLGLTRDRRMVWVGDGLVLLGVPIDPQVGDPPLVRAAWLENPLEEDPGWHLLPDSVTPPGGEWVALGHDLVNLGLDAPGLPAAPSQAEAAEQPADPPTEDTQRADPRGPSRGGVLQLDPTGWFDLPAPPDDGGSAAAVHVPPAGGGRTAVAGGRALDLVTGTWAAIPEDPALPAHPRVTAWAGDRVLVWGGPEGEALVWLPPWADETVQGAAAALHPQRPLVDPGPTRPPGPHGRPDARIDCHDEARIRLTDLSAGEDFGRDTPEQALRGHLHPQALHDGGRVVMVADIHASVVVGYRETVNATALRQPDGHWVVGLLTACGDVDLIIR
ncbi:MAG TPA: hypothetical protein VMM13_15895, partial [Euzebya sp.]|nr:hypothetical protein [Euzebya sp.]